MAVRRIPQNWFFRELRVKMWKASNKLIWGAIIFLILVSILDFLLFQEQYWEFIILNLVCAGLVIISQRLLAKVLIKPTLLLHLVLLILNFLLLYSIGISNVTGQILYLVLLAVSFISFNTIAIWKPRDAFIQFCMLGAMVFFLNSIDFINLENLLLLGGYTTFSLCLVSTAFPSIKTLSLMDEIEDEYKQSQKISDFGLESQVLKREVDNNKSKLIFLETQAKIFQHDLKNYLGSIESLTELIELEDRYLKNADGPDYLAIIKNALNEANEKNEEFFRNFSEDATEAEKIKKVPLELNDIIHKNIYKFIEQTSSRNINFDLALKAKASVVLGDSKILNTAIYNLLKYTLDFSKNNDIVKVISRNENDNVILELVNADSGMSMATMESYFKNINIYNLENIQNNQGLGLSIAKRNIEQLDGHLSYSASNSLGFEFQVEFKIKN